MGSMQESLQHGVERSVEQAARAARNEVTNALRSTVQGVQPSEFKKQCKAQLSAQYNRGIREPVRPEGVSTRSNTYKAYRSSLSAYRKWKRGSKAEIRRTCADLTKQYRTRHKARRNITNPIIDSLSSGLNAEIKNWTKGLFGSGGSSSRSNRGTLEERRADSLRRRQKAKADRK